MLSAYMIDLITLKTYFKQLVPLTLIVGLVMTFSMGTPVALVGMFFVMFLVMGSMSANAYDELNDWAAYRLTLPLSRRDVVIARYLTVLTLAGVAAVSAVVVEGALFALGRAIEMPEVLAMVNEWGPEDLLASVFTAGACIVIGAVISGVNIPAFFLLGTTRATQFMPIVVILVLGVGGGFVSSVVPESVMAAVGAFGAWVVEPQNTVLAFAGCLGVAALIWGVSAAVALKLYERRDL